RVVEGSYALRGTTARLHPLVLVGAEFVRVITLHDAKAVEPVRPRSLIEKIVGAFRGNKDSPGEEAPILGRLTKIIRELVAKHVLANGGGVPETGVNVDVGAVRVGEGNVEFPARSVGLG